MWIQLLSRNSWAVVLGVILSLLLGFGALGEGYAGKPPATPPEPPPPAPAPSPGDMEIIFTGKIFCSLKRRVDLPFKGVVTSLRVHSGQKVQAGDILATYRLSPESMAAIKQRLSPPQLSDLEIKLAEADRVLVPLLNKKRELTQLVEKKLAPPQSLTQANQEVALLQKEKATLQERLNNDRQLAQQDQELLSQLLGMGVKAGQVPREVALKAPISGYVILVNPEVRDGAELTPMPAAFLVGVMDPMVVRAQAFEIEALQIKVGDQGEISLDALPGEKFQARVSRISWSSSTTAPEQPAYYDVELQVPNPNLALKEGLKARIILHPSR